MKKLDKDGFIRELSEETGYTMGDTRRFVDALTTILGRAVIKGIEIEVRGLWRLYYQKLPAREGFKPISGVPGGGEKVQYPEATRVILKLSSNIRNLAKEDTILL